MNVHASKLEYATSLQASATRYNDKTIRRNNSNYYSADMNKGEITQLWTHVIGSRNCTRKKLTRFIPRVSGSTFAKWMNELHRLTHNKTDLIPFHALAQHSWRHFPASGWAVTSLIFTKQTPIRGKYIFLILNLCLFLLPPSTNLRLSQHLPSVS
jgi:hypothetical protein